jgi:hypothetical protein
LHREHEALRNRIRNREHRRFGHARSLLNL